MSHQQLDLLVQLCAAGVRGGHRGHCAARRQEPDTSAFRTLCCRGHTDRQLTCQAARVKQQEQDGLAFGGLRCGGPSRQQRQQSQPRASRVDKCQTNTHTQRQRGREREGERERERERQTDRQTDREREREREREGEREATFRGVRCGRAQGLQEEGLCLGQLASHQAVIKVGLPSEVCAAGARRACRKKASAMKSLLYHIHIKGGSPSEVCAAGARRACRKKASA